MVVFRAPLAAFAPSCETEKNGEEERVRKRETESSPARRPARDVTGLRRSFGRFPGVALPIVADVSRPRRRSSVRAREVACGRAHGRGEPRASDGEGVGDDGDARTHARTAGRSVDRSDGRWSTRSSDGGPETRAAYERYFPACLMSSSAAPLLLLLVVRWLCSWTEEGRRT